MNYEDFLSMIKQISTFSQLFMNYIEIHETEYQELEYDSVFPEILKHQQLFLKSPFNVDTKSEYDCIVDYLVNELK